MFLRGGRGNATRREWGRKSAGQLQGQGAEGRAGAMLNHHPQFSRHKPRGPQSCPIARG